MEKSVIKTAESGIPTTLILHVPDGISADGSEITCFALAVRFRPGGILLCIPRGVLSEESLIQALSGEDPSSLLGPSKLLEVPLIEEADGGEIAALSASAHMYVVDFSDDVLALLSEYDGSPFEEQSPVGFSVDFPAALPEHNSLLGLVEAWIVGQSSDRVNFYSAREETEQPVSPKQDAKGAPAKKQSATPKRVSNAQVMESIAALTEQVRLLATRQQMLEDQGARSFAAPAPEQHGGGKQMHFAGLPPVSSSLVKSPGLSLEGVAKSANLVGPPPRTRTPIDLGLGSNAQAGMPTVPPGVDLTGDGVASALFQQSSAITALVAHLTASTDPLGDLSLTGGGGTSSTSTKGSQRREKMQADLAAGSSAYYLAMMQQVHRRMHPGKPVPRTEADLASVSLLTYLERTGGYKGAKEAGLLMWLLGHIGDAASAGNMWLVRERLALTMVALEQSVVDGGDWSLAYLLSLAEDPPLALFQDRSSTVSPYATPFSPMVPQAWAAVLLSYVKEMEILATKKFETSPRKTKAAVPKADDEKPDRAPKRKPRFPKKPQEPAPATK